MRSIAFVSCLGIFVAGALNAQEVPPFSFAIGGGYTNSLGTAGRYLDNGWNLQAGVGYNFNSYLGAMLDFNYSSLGVNSATLANIGAPGGNVNIASFTIDPIVHLHRKGPVDFYLIGGGGLYHRYDDLTAPSVGFGPVPTPFGFFNAPIAGETVIASYSINKPGFNAGAGVTFGTRWHAKLYAEARYTRMLTSTPTDYIPVTVGVRW
jgi:opacity protein-like surface antigen